MLNVLTNLSNILIPIVIFYIVATGIAAKKDVYGDFIKGAADGVKTVIQIMPTLVGLMIAVGILKASGFLTFLGELFGMFTAKIGIPADVVPLIFVRLFSSSAATGIALSIFKTHGTDSYVGMLTSILMSCTETVFYTMSVYFMTAKVTKTRWTLAGALISTLAGVVMSVILAGIL